MHRILIAEDSRAQSGLLHAHLLASGYDAVVVHDGREAVERLAAGPFDLVLSDVVMPRMDGYELCRHVKREHPDLPVVLLTGLADPIEIVRGLEAGADNFLRKPCEPDHLMARLNAVLDYRELRAGGHSEMFMEVVLHGQRFKITAERQQILDLLVSSFEDYVTVTEQLRASEDALRASGQQLAAQSEALGRERARLHAILGAVPQAMVVTDRAGVVTEASSGLAALLGGRPSTLVGRQVREAMTLRSSSGEEVPPSLCPLQRVLRGETDHSADGAELFVQAVGGLVPVSVRVTAIRTESGELVGVVGVLSERAERMPGGFRRFSASSR